MNNANQEDNNQTPAHIAEGITVLICGGRNWNYPKMTFRKLDALHQRHRFGKVVHGAAKGADTLADKWAKKAGVQVEAYPAIWRPAELGGRVDRRAGFTRNKRMLDQAKPGLVIAFPGGSGTSDMVRRAHQAGVKVINLKDIVASWRDLTGMGPV